MQKMRLRPALAPDPTGELTTLFQTPYSAGRGHLFQILTILKKTDGIYRFCVRI